MLVKASKNLQRCLAQKEKPCALWPLLAVDTQLWANFEEWGDEQKGDWEEKARGIRRHRTTTGPHDSRSQEAVHVSVQVGTEGRDFALHSSVHRTSPAAGPRPWHCERTQRGFRTL